MDPGYAILFGIACLIEPDVTLGDLNAFPPYQVCVEMQKANGHARKILLSRSNMEPRHGALLWEARCQTGRAGSLWELLAQAHDKDWSIEARLAWLRYLRRDLGAKDYYGGIMPPPYPYWAFPEVVDCNQHSYVPMHSRTTQ